jgi:DNA-binding response OmpR family regulator
MNSKTLIVYESKILFDILEEIKEHLNLEILNVTDKDFDNLNVKDYENCVVISLKNPKNFENCLVIESLPKKISKILEKINIFFLKNKYFDQSELKVGKYKLDINARQISFDNTSLSLTEKETELIIYINSKKNVSLKELQNNVWKYSSDLETHTVETHIYRLRKKLSEKFNDMEFIKHDKKGYSII